MTPSRPEQTDGEQQRVAGQDGEQAALGEDDEGDTPQGVRTEELDQELGIHPGRQQHRRQQGGVECGHRVEDTVRPRGNRRKRRREPRHATRGPGGPRSGSRIPDRGRKDPAGTPSCWPRVTDATSSMSSATGPSTPSSRSWTPAAIRCGWPSRTGSTTSTSARSCGRPMRSTSPACTSSDGVDGTVGAPWSPTATCTCTTTPTSPPSRRRWRPRAARSSASTTCRGRCHWRPTRLPERVCLVFGSEGPGLTDELVAVCEQLVSISQYGSTRSLNAGAAAAIAMYHWALQWAVARQRVMKAEDEP